MSVELNAKIIYCLVDLTKLTIPQRQVLFTNLNSETSGRFSYSKLYIFNGDSLELSTRLIIQCEEKILDKPFAKTLIDTEMVKKIMEIEIVQTPEGIKTVKETQLSDYLRSPTSWYIIVKSST